MVCAAILGDALDQLCVVGTRADTGGRATRVERDVPEGAIAEDVRGIVNERCFDTMVYGKQPSCGYFEKAEIFREWK